MIDMKKSEARIIVYLSQVSNNNKWVSIISAKLNIDYAYIIKILKLMKAKHWIRSDKQRIKTYYFLTKLAPLESAKLKLDGRRK